MWDFQAQKCHGACRICRIPARYYHPEKDNPAPYSITNAGLNIHMRVLMLDGGAATHDPGALVSALGILNCHCNNELGRNIYLALPLETTGIDSTYRRAPSPLIWVSAGQANSAEYRTIFIQLQAVQVSRITLLQDYDQSEYGSQVHTIGLNVYIMH
jgi:hypothetical protein